MEAQNIDTTPLKKQADELRQEGQTVMFVAVDGKLGGLVSVADPIKSSTPEALKALHEAGIKVVMLTGDNKTTADAVAKKLGIDRVEAEILPDQKPKSLNNCRPKAISWQWRVTVSTMRRHWRRHT